MDNLLEETRWKNSRRIVKRIVIQGQLVLETPTQLSNGDADGAADMSLLRDPLEGKALLTGTSIAGALRSYLRRRELGFRTKAGRDSLTAKLFGPHVQRTEATPGDPGDSEQSYLITHDALGDYPETELRDGVAINPVTRTAEDKKKYDLELLTAGTIFPLRFELLIPEADGMDVRLRRACAVALSGLENGEIRLGARKRRGFGRCRITAAGWSVTEYDLTKAPDLIAWLRDTGGETRTGTSIAELVDQSKAAEALDQRERFTLTATFEPTGSLLIRSGSADPQAPDMVHLKSLRNGALQPVLSGTSLGGALRGRGLRIAKTVGNDADATDVIDSLFGPWINEENRNDPRAGRLWVEETVIREPHELVVTRVKIDRFTGGSYPGALFNQQPLFPKAETEVVIALNVDAPRSADIGLLLLLLKDLWTQDLPLGGEASVGRGRLTGKHAMLRLRGKGGALAEWAINQTPNGLEVEGDQNVLEEYVSAFVAQVNGRPNGRPDEEDQHV